MLLGDDADLGIEDRIHVPKTSEIVDGLEAAKVSFLNLVQRLRAESSAAAAR